MSDSKTNNEVENISKDRNIQGRNSDCDNLKTSETDNSFEVILSQLKLTARYHRRFIFLMSFAIITNSVCPINYIFAAEEVGYGCKYANCTYTDLLKLKYSDLDYKCKRYELFDNNGKCTKDNFDVARFTICSEWVYEDPNSFVAEFNLACQDWKRTFVGTMHSIGFMIGLLIIGPLSDKFGRKAMVILISFLAGVLGISKSMVRSYWLFIALETLESMLGDNYSTAYTMVAEYFTTKNRPLMAFISSVSNATGTIWMALMAYLTPNWRTYLISIYTPSLLVVLYIFYIDESPRWLLIKGRKSEADEIIRKAAKVNNVKIEESEIAKMRCEKTSTLKLREAIKVTFSSGKLLLRFLFCCCIWFTSLYNDYSLLINSVGLEGDRHLNFVLVTLADIPGGLISSLALKKLKRKAPLIGALSMTGVFCVLQSLVPKGYRWLAALLYLCGKVNATITMETIYLYTTELFPTYTRNTMLSLCSAFGRFGSALAPLTPLLVVYWSGLPLFLVGILSLTTASIVTLMPDTSKEVLPDDVTQAEVLGMEKNRSISKDNRI